ncbi:MAG: glucosylceramidase [Myxococcota bacterium]|jgi:glucosylceramidase
MPTVKLFETSPAGHRLTALAPPAFQPGLENWYQGQAIVLEPRVRYQTWLGFGGAFTESAAFVLSHLDHAAQDAILTLYFHPTDGLGYRFGRTHINSCDFSLGNWSCADVPGDLALEHFDLSRTHQYITPLIKRALAIEGAQIDLLASPWSPPGWMKTTGEMNHGGKLRPEHRQVWADHYVRWILGMREAGVQTWGLTVQNEPAAVQVWDSCIYSAEEERDFVRDHLGPALHAAGLQAINVVIWDHNREIAFDRAYTVLSDPEAAKFVWGTGLHWYSGDYFDQLTQIHDTFPEHHLMFTEGCCEGGVKLGQYDRATRYVHHILGDMNHGCEAWLDWNLVLDHTGGPNHVGNLCDAPIIVDTRTGEVHKQPSFYAIGQFSRFIQRGAQRIGRSTVGGPLESTAWRNPGGGLVLLVFNPSDDELTYRVLVGDGGVQGTIGGLAIQTWVLSGV